MGSPNIPGKPIRTVVSITPLRVQADSRTFKEAASVANFGYVSVVVEGQESDLAGESLPFMRCTVKRKGKVTKVALPIESPSPAPAPTQMHEDTSHLRKEKVAVLEFNRRLDRVVRVSSNLSRRLPAWSRIAGKALFVGLIRFLRVITWQIIKARQTYREVMVSAPVLFVKYLCDFFYKYGVLPLRFTPRASLYYLHAFYQFPAVYLLCLRYGVRYIYDAHDFYSRLEDDEGQLNFWERWVVPFERFVETWCMRKAAAVVTVNEGIAQLILETFGRRAVVIRNTHDLRLDREPRQYLREHLGLSSDQMLIVSVGHAKPGMATEEMFKAMVELPSSVHIAFLGDGYAPYVKSVRQKGIFSRVHFVQPVKPYEIVPFIRSADAAVILYYPKSADYRFSLPNRFFQAIAAELPLLYPNLPEIKRIAEFYSLGICIDPQEPESIRAAVIRLMGNPGLVNKIRQNLASAREELSWEHEEVILKNLISKCLNES